MEKHFSVFSVYYVIDAVFNFKKFATVEFCRLSTHMRGSMVKSQGWIGGMAQAAENNGWKAKNQNQRVQS